MAQPTTAGERRLPSRPELRHVLSTSLCKLFLTLSDRCNLRCAYCPYVSGEGYRKERHGRLSDEGVQEAIRFFLQRSTAVDRPVINLFGGEPFLDFPAVRRAVECGLREAPHRPVEFSVTTNGTLMQAAWLPWLSRHRVRLRISMAGDRVHQDHLRQARSGRGSFAQVLRTLTRLADFDPLYARECVSVRFVEENGSHRRATLDMLEEKADLFDHFSISAAVTTECCAHPRAQEEGATGRGGMERGLEGWKSILDRAAAAGSRSVRSYHLQLLQRAIRPTLAALRGATQNDTAMPGGMCIPCQPSLVVDTEGRFLPCFMAEPLGFFGNLRDGFDLEAFGRLFDGFATALDEGLLECDACELRSACSLCWLSGIGRDGVYHPSHLARLCGAFKESARRSWLTCAYLSLHHPATMAELRPNRLVAGYQSNCYG